MRVPIALPLAAVAALSVAACGTLPQPFRGNPGATARELAQPPIPPRLIVPAPATAMLPDSSGKALAALLARDLQLREVPAYAEPPHAGDWLLDVHAETQGGNVVPVFIVRTPQGKEAGKLAGAPVPMAAWADASTRTLQQVAAQATPSLAAMLSGIDTTLQKADPNSLYHRAAKLALLSVSGAPGDGDAALTILMRKRLMDLGEQIQDQPQGADFVLKGIVRMAPAGAGQQRVEIQWILTDAQGRERGRVVQLNEIPAGSLNGAWGEVADAVTQEASGGVRELVAKQTQS